MAAINVSTYPSPDSTKPSNATPMNKADEFGRTDADKKKAADEQANSLGHHVQKTWQLYKNHTETTNRREINLKCLRAYRGEYSTQQLQEIQQFGGSTAYSHITSTKCRGATALLRDIFLGQEKIWGLAATPDPGLPDDLTDQVHRLVDAELAQIRLAGQPMPPEEMIQDRTKQLMEEARKAGVKKATEEAKKAEKHLQDLLQRGGFYDALVEFITDLPVFPMAIIKGPVVKRVTANRWVNGRLQRHTVPQMQWYRVSPFDLYFTPGASRLEEADTIEVSKVSRAELNQLIGLPGYNEDAIRAVLTEYAHGFVEARSDDAERADREGRENPQFNQSGLIDSLEWQGAIQGKMLRQYGFDETQIPDEDLDYFVQAWVIGRHTIKVQISPDANKRHNYYGTSFEKVPGAIGGISLPEILEDLQRMANGSLRALANNMAMCLTGDTVVYKSQRPGAGAGGDKPITLDALWSAHNKPRGSVKRHKLRAMDTDSGEFFYDRIADMYDNGVQAVYEVKTKAGYAIKSTLNHRFFNNRWEWQELGLFQPGDEIGVNGQAVRPAVKASCVDCGTPLSRPDVKRCRRHASQFENNKWNQEQAETARNNPDASITTAHARRACKDARKDYCEVCDTRTGPFEVHHKDRNPWHNEPENLINLCVPCHKYEHHRHDHLGDGHKHRYLDFDEIESITYVGRERVFDLRMESEHHCFVANGLVSHNSSGPQVAINEDRLSPSTNGDTMYPWKRWRFLDDPLATNSLPAVDFFQPQSNATELLNVYQAMTNMADETSSIPRYLTGNERVGGAGRTASGLSMLMSSASKMMQVVAANIDAAVVRPVIQNLYDMVMLTADSTNSPLRGDEEIIVRGVEVARQRDQERSRMLELLSLTANPVDSQILGVRGRALLLRELSKQVGIPGTDLVPSDDDLLLLEQRQEVERQAALEQGRPDPTTQAVGSAPKASNPTPA